MKNNNKLIKFLFPFWPVKVFKSITGICILAALLGISILLNLLKVPIASGITISFAWLPVIIIGWYFGPIIGLLMGFVIDTINWLIFGGVWFWLYALQEPFLGLIVGLVASSFRTIQNLKNHFQICLIINQVMFIAFLIVSLFLVFYYTDQNNPFFQNISNKNSNTAEMIKITQKYLRWVILGVLILLFILVEAICIYKYREWKTYEISKTNNFETFLFVTIVVLISTLIFSFLLGPIAAIEYYKFLHNTNDVPSLINYGAMYYLLPRVIKECFKTPAYIMILSALICALDPAVTRIKNKLFNSY